MPSSHVTSRQIEMPTASARSLPKPSKEYFCARQFEGARRKPAESCDDTSVLESAKDTSLRFALT